MGSMGGGHFNGRLGGVEVMEASVGFRETVLD